ncbi:MAG: EpsG family protein [Clostridia bacterium]|nr:EpsG family protein [Clostridia bacterium]
MLPYYIMIAVPAVFYLLYGGTNQYFNNEKKQKATIFAFFGVFLILLMLRSEDVGCDIITYLASFEKVGRMSFSDIFVRFESEQGYWLLNKVISVFTTNKQIFIAIMAILCLVPVARLYFKESENALLSISIFLILPNCEMVFSGLRQAIAIAIVAISYKYVKEKKLFKFILIILLAITFHKSAFVAFLLYPFYHINITKGKLFAFIPAIIGVLIFNKPIFEFLLQFLGEYGEMYEYEETGAYTMIILFALFFIFSYFVPDEKQMDKETIGLRNLSVLTLMLQIFALANPVAMRMNYYFILFLPILIPKIINRTHERNKQICQFVGFFMTVFFLIYYFYKANVIVDTLNLYPYEPFWK